MMEPLYISGEFQRHSTFWVEKFHISALSGIPLILRILPWVLYSPTSSRLPCQPFHNSGRRRGMTSHWQWCLGQGIILSCCLIGGRWTHSDYIEAILGRALHLTPIQSLIKTSFSILAGLRLEFCRAISNRFVSYLMTHSLHNILHELAHYIPGSPCRATLFSLF